ncbi:hypothetical protein SLA2020_228520 [Shorea laevis]
MGRQKNRPVLSHLKKVMKKLNSLIRLTRTKWRVASILRRASFRRCLCFNHSPSLQDCIGVGEGGSDEKRSPVRVLQRITSFAPDDDIDRRAEVFISNFHHRLLLERQVSLELSYCRTSSF